MKKFICFSLLVLTASVGAQNVVFTDNVFKNLLLDINEEGYSHALDLSGNYLAIDANSDGEIQVSEALMVGTLNIEQVPDITNLQGLEAFVNLVDLRIINTGVTSIAITGMPDLASIEIEDNNSVLSCTVTNLPALTFMLIHDSMFMTSFDITGCNAVEDLFIGYAEITALDLSGKTNLKRLYVQQHNLTALDLTDCTSLLTLDCAYNQITSLDITSPLLQVINVTGNLLADIDLLDCPDLTEARLGGNLFTSVDLSGLTQLEFFELLNSPNLETVDVSGCTSLTGATLISPGLQTVGLSGCSAMVAVNIVSDVLQSVAIAGCTALQTFRLSSMAEILGVPLNNLDFSGFGQLEELRFEYVNVQSVNLSGCTSLWNFSAVSGGLASIDFSGNPNLQIISIMNNPLETLDVSNQPGLINLNVDASTQLKRIFANNGANETLSFNITPMLEYICVDSNQVSGVQQTLNTMGLTNVVCNSYCSFTPGGDFNTISGNMVFDADDNGCNALDPTQPNIRININDGTQTGATFTNASGIYNFYTLAGNFTLTPDLENPALFTVTPAMASVAFADDNNNTASQNFCMVANGVQSDVEIVFAPITAARPGFAATYQLVIRNKGNQVLSGTYGLAYDDPFLDFVSATTAPDLQSAGLLNWNYTDLLPFENRSVYIVMNVNSPMQVPAVNIDDILHFTATVDPIAGDINQPDNTFGFDQIVVGPYDPNDITCLEGDVVAPSGIGGYLHYIINFENTGNYAAENVVVSIAIDDTKYDINSLQLLNTSHPVQSVIRGNTVEFMFENIFLAPAAGDPPVGGHGNILFKIKTNPALVTGDFVNKMAKIYFDYNAAIETNDFQTTFVALSVPGFENDESVVVYPNPGTEHVIIKCNSTIRSVELFDIQGRILQATIGNGNETQLDISGKSNGIYFIRVMTDNGIKVEKLAKE